MPHNPLGSEGFQHRLVLAYHLWQGRNARRLTQTQLGERVGKPLGRAVGQYTVSDWFRGVSMPSLEETEALALVLEVDPGWLAFGHASESPAPEGAPPTNHPAPKKRR